MGAAVNDMPPLPPPDRTMHQYGKQIDHFTADQMRAYAQAALDALNDELEASLKRMIDAGLGQIPAANSKPANAALTGAEGVRVEGTVMQKED